MTIGDAKPTEPMTEIEEARLLIHILVRGMTRAQLENCQWALAEATRRINEMRAARKRATVA